MMEKNRPLPWPLLTPAGAVLSRITSHNMTGQQLTYFTKRQIVQLKKPVEVGRVVGRWEPESLHACLRARSKAGARAELGGSLDD